MKDNNGRTALMLAALEGNVNSVNVLSEFEAGLTDNGGWTAR